MGILERKLDQDLIDRMLAGWTPPKKEDKPKKNKKPPRSWKTYRAIRMNIRKHGIKYEL